MDSIRLCLTIQSIGVFVMDPKFLVTCGYFPYVILNLSVMDDLCEIAYKCCFTLVDIFPISRNDTDACGYPTFMYQIVLTSNLSDDENMYELNAMYCRFRRMACEYFKGYKNLQNTSEKH